MALGAVRILGYAIISRDGMIANADGLMPDSLIIEADQIFFRSSLMQAQVVIHGRNSFEGGLDVPGRHRVIVTRTVDAITAISATPHILRWNPFGAALADVLRVLKVTQGDIAVIGGTDVFDLFLNIGYDAFYLTTAGSACLPGGRPLFRGVPALSPRRILAGRPLSLKNKRALEDNVILEEWSPPNACYG
jgi:dihydrofolate reductase